MKLCSVASWGWIFLGLVFLFLGFFFPPLSLHCLCGGAGFLLSVSEVCSGDEKD